MTNHTSDPERPVIGQLNSPRGILEIPRSWDKKAVPGDRGQREQSGPGE